MQLMLAMAAEQQREKGRSHEGGEPTGRHMIIDDEAPGGIGEGSAAADCQRQLRVSAKYGFNNRKK
jgi:hypothetical protein